MLLSSTAIVKWNAKNKSHYVGLGYEFTKMGDAVEVSVDDLTVGSRAEINLMCDYCGKVFTQWWCTYLRLKRDGILHTDCCGDPCCTGEKSKLSIIQKYNVPNVTFIDGVKEKREKTNLNRFGVKNVFASEQIKNKIRASCVDKYGVEHPMMLQSIQAKVSDTCMRKYGVRHYLNLDYGAGMRLGEDSPRWNPNKTNLQRESERRLPDYRVWRKNVLERDGYSCVRCGGKGVVYGRRCRSNGLNAHHILSYKTSPETRYDVDNGITLCNKCHSLFHSTYGRTGNNREQLLDFLSKDKEIC